MTEQEQNSRRLSNRTPQQQRQQYMIYGVAIILIVLIAGGLAYVLLDDPPEVAEDRLDLEASLGTSGASVQVIEYGAYGCFTCRRVHESGVIEQVLDRHGDNIEFVFRNYPVINPQNDPISAEAAQCALDQGEDAFWRFHNAVYNLSNSEYSQHSEEADYVALAGEIGLNADDLQACLEANTHERTVEHWKEKGDQVGIPGTPVFLVNGRRLSNADELEEAVLDELNGSS